MLQRRGGRGMVGKERQRESEVEEMGVHKDKNKLIKKVRKTIGEKDKRGRGGEKADILIY